MMKRMVGAVVLSWGLAGCVSSQSQMSAKQREEAAVYNLQMGIDYLQKGNLSQAKEKLERSLDQNPRNAQTHVAAGLLYDRIDENDKADSHLSRAVSLDSDNAAVLNNYAQFLCRKGNRDKGEQLAVKAASDPLYKTPEAAWLNAGLCALNSKKMEAAEKYFRNSLAAKPNWPTALFQLADFELKAGNFLPARGFLQRYMQVTATNPAALWLGVQIEKGLGNVAGAEDYARRLKNDFPTSGETKALLESERKAG